MSCNIKNNEAVTCKLEVTMAKEDKTLSLDFKSEDKTLIHILKLTSNEKQWNTVQYPTAIDQSAASIRVKQMINVFTPSENNFHLVMGKVPPGVDYDITFEMYRKIASSVHLMYSALKGELKAHIHISLYESNTLQE